MHGRSWRGSYFMPAQADRCACLRCISSASAHWAFHVQYCRMHAVPFARTAYQLQSLEGRVPHAAMLLVGMLDVHAMHANEPLLRRYVAQFRKWLDERAGGVPTPYPANAPLPALETRKEVVLDRWNQHTKHCAACMRVRLLLTHKPPLLAKYRLPQSAWYVPCQ